MLRNCDDMLRKQAMGVAELEAQNRWLVELIKIAHQKARVNNREIAYQPANERQERPGHLAEKQS